MLFLLTDGLVFIITAVHLVVVDDFWHGTENLFVNNINSVCSFFCGESTLHMWDVRDQKADSGILYGRVASPGKRDVQLAVRKTGFRQVYADAFECLPLGFVNSHSERQLDWELFTLEDERHSRR